MREGPRHPSAVAGAAPRHKPPPGPALRPPLATARSGDAPFSRRAPRRQPRSPVARVLCRQAAARRPAPAGSLHTSTQPGSRPAGHSRTAEPGERPQPGQPGDGTSGNFAAGAPHPHLDDAAPPRGGLGRLQKGGIGVGCCRPQAAAGKALGGTDGRDTAAALSPPACGCRRGVQRSRFGLLLGTMSGVGGSPAGRRLLSAADSLCHRPAERCQLLRGAERAEWEDTHTDGVPRRSPHSTAAAATFSGGAMPVPDRRRSTPSAGDTGSWAAARKLRTGGKRRKCRRGGGTAVL